MTGADVVGAGLPGSSPATELGAAGKRGPVVEQESHANLGGHTRAANFVETPSRESRHTALSDYSQSLR